MQMTAEAKVNGLLSTAPRRELSDLPRAPGWLPYVGHAGSLLHRPSALLESLRRLGPIVRVDLGSTAVYMLTQPELIHAVLVTEARCVQRDGILFERIREVVGSGLAASEGELHLKQRRLMQPSFQRRRIDGYLNLMREHTQALADSWRNGQCVELDQALFDLVAVNGGSLFGMDLGPQMSRAVCHALATLTDNFMIRLQTPKALERLPVPGNRRFNRALADLRQIIERLIQQRLGSATAGDDLLGTLLTAIDPATGQPLSHERVYDEVISTLLAGIVTTAPTLAWLFYELDRCPTVQDRVLDEIRRVCDGGTPPEEALGQLDYTRRTVQEILRLHPILMVIRRVTQPLELSGVTLPVGTNLGYSPRALHRDPDIFPDPARLDPDRWLPGRTAPMPVGAFSPFGEGRHRCIGEHFAWAEIMTALVVLLPRWQLRLAPRQTVREVGGGHLRPSSLRMIAQVR
jgi:cytochrome P450